jgi:pimeloyl-ACP methyl ester carboxylesterase
VIFEPTLATVIQGKPEHEEALAAWGEGFVPTVEAVQRGADEEAVRLAIEHAFSMPEGGFDALPELNRTVLLDNAHTVAALFAAPEPTPLTCDDLAEIEASVLILWGGETMPFFEAAAKEVADCLSDATLEEMPGVGHGGPVEAEDDFLDRMLGFIKAADEA